jgi:hypothetical protein
MADGEINSLHTDSIEVAWVAAAHNAALRLASSTASGDSGPMSSSLDRDAYIENFKAIYSVMREVRRER